MILRTNKLRDAILFALAVGSTALTGTGMAFAQDATTTQTGDTATDQEQNDDGQTQEEAQQLETITVTGTRIQSREVTASSPVMVIQKEAFQFSGTTRAEDLVNQYPQLSPAFDSMNNNPSLGYPTVDLRGLGAGRTLTLVNGRRLAPGASEAADISIVPSFLVKRVDILTGGASAVYGSDAVGGVVNFILDTDFEGVQLNVGMAGYQHDNDNEYIQGLMDQRDFPYPTGNSGIDGKSYNIDLAVGSAFAGNRGHAMAWMSWRQNDALFQSERDYSACALNAAGTGCGGSNTSATGNFYFYQAGAPEGSRGSSASLNPDGTYKNSYGAPFNYAPLNYYQRPDERYTFGSSVKYEINEHFKPYIETMFISKKDSVELAPSGVFFNSIDGIDCSDPLIGSACADLGYDPANGPLLIYIAKRNVEGGPRHSDTNTNQWRIVGGVEGAINSNWSYDATYLYGQTNAVQKGINDFLNQRIEAAILGCPAGSFAGCIPYQVFIPGGVTSEAAAGMSGTSLLTTDTETMSIQGYVTGDTGFGFPWAGGENVTVAIGANHAVDRYNFNADSDSQAGNFSGSGGPSTPVSGKVSVNEGFVEANIPVFKSDGFFQSLNLDLGYRRSSYNLAGDADTYKLGFTADLGTVRVRGGYNRAIRAPGINALFSPNAIALWSGQDPCAGATPIFTEDQCARTGVPAGKYGSVPDNSANQYNQFIGGNIKLTPEIADTYTLGFVVNPMDDLRVSLDYYDIAIEDTISTIGASTILEQCALTGDPKLCALVHRNPASGDLWRGSDPATSGLITNLTGNFGEVHFRGVDLAAFYRWEMFGGQFNTSFQGNYLLEQEIAPLAPASDSATYDCAGIINGSCQSPEWRHIANLRYSSGIYTVGLRWRYFGAMDYVDNNGVALTTDKLLCGSGAGCMGDGELGDESYLDLSGSVYISTWGQFTLGVNNIMDKAPPMVGGSLVLNANAPGGYDQVGRYIFASLGVNF